MWEGLRCGRASDVGGPPMWERPPAAILIDAIAAGGRSHQDPPQAARAARACH
jgi:hypothetical protein